MKFSDLLPQPGRRQVGQVIEAAWDPNEKGIRFVLRFEPSGRKVSGVCRSGIDPQSGRFISETDLRAQLTKFLDLKVYENPGWADPNTLSAEEFQKMKIEISLENLSVSYRSQVRHIDANTFLSRLFR